MACLLYTSFIFTLAVHRFLFPPTDALDAGIFQLFLQSIQILFGFDPVSYTHLDVYKRQIFVICGRVVDVWKPQTGSLSSRDFRASPPSIPVSYTHLEQIWEYPCRISSLLVAVMLGLALDSRNLATLMSIGVRQLSLIHI